MQWNEHHVLRDVGLTLIITFTIKNVSFPTQVTEYLNTTKHTPQHLIHNPRFFTSHKQIKIPTKPPRRKTPKHQTHPSPPPSLPRTTHLKQKVKPTQKLLIGTATISDPPFTALLIGTKSDDFHSCLGSFKPRLGSLRCCGIRPRR